MVDLVFGMAKRVSAPSTTSKRRVVIGICVILAAITWLVFGQTLGHEFVTYDDPQYVSGNAEVAAGLSIEGVRWAFTHTIGGNWHPLTIISHMLDCQLYGLNAAGHHLTNVLLHTIAVILLFLVLRQMTGTLWRSAFVAALFAIHPLHVESVAWISERKDVLSGVLFILTLGAYVRYIHALSTTAYLLVLILFALGLMSKPMLVTVPFVLLLLDYWPLGRCSNGPEARLNDRRGRSQNAPQARGYSGWLKLIIEKLPLFALSALFSAVTVVAQLHSTGISNQLPFAWRLSNASVSYVTYIWQMFWPTRIAAFYPHPNDQLPFWQIVLAIVIFAAITVAAIRWRKERPYIFTGWFWYIGMLVPVIGLVQAGEQARADRYTYLPQIGLYVLITWGITDLVQAMTTRNFSSRRVATGLRPVTLKSPGASAGGPSAFAGPRRGQPGRGYKLLCAVIAAAIIISLSWRASVQASYWKDSGRLWNHTLAVTGDNDVAHNNLGNLCLQRGDLDSALLHFETALNIRARTAAAYYNFGGALIENCVAAILAKKGQINEAIPHYNKAINMRPAYGDPYLNLGNVLFQQGQLGDALAQWDKALGTEPHDATFHTLLGDAFLRAGSQKIAIAEYARAIRISAHDALGRNNLAWLLATSSDASIRDGNRAIELAKQAVRLSHGKDPNYLRTLAAAFAESGHFVEAKETAQQALQVAESRSNSALVNALRDEITLYDLGLPYHN
jgi:protein O-mannosyl-transferase